MLEIDTRQGYEYLLDLVLAKLSRIAPRIGDRVLEVRPTIMQTSKHANFTNLAQTARTMNRDPDHLARFILKETGRAGSVQEDRLVIQGRMPLDELSRLLELYAKEFVKCPVCGSIDTKIVSEKRFRFLVCEACGAKNPVRRI